MSQEQRDGTEDPCPLPCCACPKRLVPQSRNQRRADFLPALLFVACGHARGRRSGARRLIFLRASSKNCAPPQVQSRRQRAAVPSTCQQCKPSIDRFVGFRGRSRHQIDPKVPSVTPPSVGARWPARRRRQQQVEWKDSSERPTYVLGSWKIIIDAACHSRCGF